MTAPTDPLGTRDTLKTPMGPRAVHRLDALGDEHAAAMEAMPCSIRVLLESCLRHLGEGGVTEDHVRTLASYDATAVPDTEIPFTPGRVLMQDFTGVPSMVDLAAMRDAIVELTGDEASAGLVNPLAPCDLVIDHSVQVDAFNSGVALTINNEKEFERNEERYRFLKWGQGAFDNFRVVPPATGIVHQVNLEHLARVVWERDGMLFPDSLVGTDSHTTMINGLGVLGWGVGGIEAEAVMLGQPISMLVPAVVGFRLSGSLPEGSTATDLVLRVTEMLREHGVVGSFVEFHGPGLSALPLATRATIANMAPEYGATVGFFPIDERTLVYLRLTGRDEDLVETVERYCRLQGLWHDPDRPLRFTEVVELDLGSVEPSLAGPRRPQDRVALRDMKTQWAQSLQVEWGRDGSADPVEIECESEPCTIGDGSVVIAAITSCTNTSNPEVMVGAGLVARRARQRGLTRRPWVKTSLAPGSKVVTEYLERAGLMEDLEALGFHLVGYGCTTCIGNSGPLPEPVQAAVRDRDLVACSVLSGNRNFDGRIHPDVRASFLASPPLVVAYAIAGRVDLDLVTEPLGTDAEGRDVHLRDLWPSAVEIQSVIDDCLDRDQFRRQYTDAFEGAESWRAIEPGGGTRYAWSPDSTYIRRPPFFSGMAAEPPPVQAIEGARVLCLLGDSVTTDHISPAGAITADSPAGTWLQEHGVPPSRFNSYGSRRGNDHVMTRGTFANVRIRNALAPGTEGGWTTDFTDGTIRTIHEASVRARAAGVPLIVLAGKDYGMGSSRDWAAKGTHLLGVRAVLAESYERIHRSNLVGMGVLPLIYRDGESAASLGLDGTETYHLEVPGDPALRQVVACRAVRDDGTEIAFEAVARLDTPMDIESWCHGGILHAVLRRMAAAHVAR